MKSLWVLGKEYVIWAETPKTELEKANTDDSADSYFYRFSAKF